MGVIVTNKVCNMIVGMGVDLIEIERVRQAHLRYGQRFIDRLFTKSEAQYCLRKRIPTLPWRVDLRRRKRPSNPLAMGLGVVGNGSKLKSSGS